MTDYICRDICDVCYVVTHNSKVLNDKIKKVGKRTNGFIVLGIIFGAVVERCFIEQNRKIAALDEQISALNEEIKELRHEEGD